MASPSPTELTKSRRCISTMSSPQAHRSSHRTLPSSSAPPQFPVLPKDLLGTAAAVSTKNISDRGTRTRPLYQTGAISIITTIDMQAPLRMVSARSLGRPVAAEGAAEALGTPSNPIGKFPPPYLLQVNLSCLNVELTILYAQPRTTRPRRPNSQWTMDTR